jgi:plastocyanin
MASPQQLPAVAIVMAAITMAVMLYLVMVYPEERVILLEDDTVGFAINIKNNQFTPASITIKKGSSVTWKNSDTEQHSIIGADFTSGTLDPNARYTHTFSKTGVHDYSCGFHPGMHGTIIVK